MKELATEPNIYQHLPELIGILAAVISPFCIIIGYMMKKLVGRMEADLNKLEVLVTEEMEDRLTDCEKVCTQVRSLHSVNHPGQEIK